MSIKIIQSGYTWSDVNTQVGQDGLSDLVYDYDSINNSIFNILGCPLGSRGWHPTFGSLLPFLIWEPVDATTALALKQSTIDAIKTWEPRVTLVPGKSSVTPMPEGTGYSVILTYQINLTNAINAISFNISR